MKKLMLVLLLLLVGCDKVQEEVVISDEAVVSHNDDYFEIALYVTKNIYQENEEVEIYGTIEYIGEEESITIWSGEPYMGFIVETEEEVFIDFMVLTILKSTVLEKGEVMTFPLIKTGGFSENDEDADFWREFYSEERMLVPEGSYEVQFVSGFYLEEQGDYSVRLHSKFEVK